MDKARHTGYSNFDRLCKQWFALPFEDYLTTIRQHITRVRKRAHAPSSEDVVEMNMPYYWPQKDRKRGVLLLHGFMASPYSLRAISKVYHDLGFHVMTVLLPGHGTTPGEILRTRPKHWVKAAEYGYQALSQKVDEVHLFGFSMGALISTLLINQGLNPKTLALIVPALGLHGPAKLLPWAHKLTHWMPDHWPIKWIAKLTERNITAYWSTSIKGARNVFHLIRKFHANPTKSLNDRPIFQCALTHDTIVSYPPIQTLFDQNTHPNSRMVVYAPTQIDFDDPRIHCVNESQLQHNIIGLSHICPLMPKNDPYAGEKGTLHQPDHPKRVFGELTPKNLLIPHIKRTTFNPDFDHLKEQLVTYLKENTDLSIS